MNTRLLSASSPALEAKKSTPTAIDKLARRIVLSRLERLEFGQVIISDGNETLTFGDKNAAFPLAVQVFVQDAGFYSDIAFGGAVGAGEAYIHGSWSCHDLTELLRILLRNRHVLDNMDKGFALLSAPFKKILHTFNRNTRSGSRRNIAAHYDLGNDFYQLWLDRSMMYSCAYFESPETSLAKAATAKLDRICRKLNLTADDSVVEIGTGWGGFAIHAARKYGCHVTTTTISKEQHDYVRAAIAAAGLEDRITLHLKDYRDLNGKFDKLVSIEMIEAVGHEYHATFFKKCRELLQPEGEMLLQAITIADQRYDRYKKSVDFIKRYIFPGGCLTSVTDMTSVMTRHTDLRVLHLEDIGPHYATTLRHWHDRLFSRVDEARDLGCTDEFLRMWQFYLCYCESAFLERATGTVQMHMMRPDARSSVFPR